MATILEGLNKLSGKLGGAETATENLEALNAIAGAIGGETNATSNADAIDQIAEHASGGGGSSDFTPVAVTLKSSVSTATSDDDTIGFWGRGEDEGYEFVSGLYKLGTHYLDSYGFDVTTPEQTVDILMCAEPFYIRSDHPMTATGSATVETVTDPIAGSYYRATVTGDCELTISAE